MKAKMGMVLGILLAIAFVLPAAMAAEAIDNVLPVEPTPEVISASVENISLPDPGITPDSPLYGLDRAMERIQLALTFNKVEKAKLGLIHAQERLAEVNAMIHENKTERAHEAQMAHDEIMTEVENEVADLDGLNATKEMEDVVELEAKINEHRMLVERFGNVMIMTKGTLTTEQQAMIDEIIAALGNSTAKLEIEIQNKGESTKVKIKIQTGKSDSEIEDIVTNLSKRHNAENETDEDMCTTDIDCDQDENCTSGKCEDVKNNEYNRSIDDSSDIVCTTNADCDQGTFCTENKCEDLEDNEDNNNTSNDNGNGNSGDDSGNGKD